MIPLGKWLVAAPAIISAPAFIKTTSDSSVVLNVFMASEEYGPVSQYDIVVVTEELARERKPDDFSQENVSQFDFVFICFFVATN